MNPEFVELFIATSCLLGGTYLAMELRQRWAFAVSAPALLLLVVMAWPQGHYVAWNTSTMVHWDQCNRGPIIKRFPSLAAAVKKGFEPSPCCLPGEHHPRIDGQRKESDADHTVQQEVAPGSAHEGLFVARRPGT